MNRYITINSKPNPKYKEIFKLKSILESKQINHTFSYLFDGYQILLLDNELKRINDVIERKYSYGNEYDLLETWGDEDVIGRLTAEQVWEIWEKQLNAQTAD